jgi:AcrR family transcriptional regulator
MGGVAKRAGVSRQTVYNEFGNRDQLGEAMVLTELAGFMGAVGAAFDAHPDDLVAAIRAAAYGVLTAAQDQPVLQAVLSASQGAETQLLPLLTTQADHVMELAKAGIRERTAAYSLEMDQRSRDAALDTVVRLVFSHLMRLEGDADEAADDIAWVASRMLTFA